MNVIRIGLVALACLAGSMMLRVADCTLLEGFFATVISIVNAAGIGMAIYVLTVTPDAADRTVNRQERLRPSVGMPALTAQEASDIRASFSDAADKSKKNAVSLVVLIGVAAVAVVWNKTDVPCVSWPSWQLLTKIKMAHAIVFVCTGLSLLAVYDITATAFALSMLNSPEEKPMSVGTKGGSQKVRRKRK